MFAASISWELPTAPSHLGSCNRKLLLREKPFDRKFLLSLRCTVLRLGMRCEWLVLCEGQFFWLFFVSHVWLVCAMWIRKWLAGEPEILQRLFLIDAAAPLGGMWRSRPNIAVFFCDFLVGVPLKFGGFHPQTDGSVEKETNLGGSQTSLLWFSWRWSFQVFFCWILESWSLSALKLWNNWR